MVAGLGGMMSSYGSHSGEDCCTLGPGECECLEACCAREDQLPCVNSKTALIITRVAYEAIDYAAAGGVIYGTVKYWQFVADGGGAPAMGALLTVISLISLGGSVCASIGRWSQGCSSGYYSIV